MLESMSMFLISRFLHDYSPAGHASFQSQTQIHQKGYFVNTLIFRRKPKRLAQKIKPNGGFNKYNLKRTVCDAKKT